MYTEKEAKNKICPTFAMTSLLSTSYLPNITSAVENAAKIMSRCIASDCMMWRWDTIKCEKGCSCRDKQDCIKESKGRCGLAGER